MPVSAAQELVSVAALAPAPDRGRLRVAVLSDSPPERNGVGSYYADLVQQLRGRVGGAELICPTAEARRWHRYVTPPLPGDSTQRIWLPRPFKICAQLKSLRPDVIVVPTPGPYGLFGLIAARWLSVPLIVGFHTHYEALAGIYWRDTFGRLCRWYLSGCNRLLFRHSALVLANSAEMQRQARLLGAERVELMGTSVPAEFLSRPVIPASGRLQQVLFVGRLAEEKNVPTILELARQRPEVRFSIVGDGPLREAVRNAAAALDNLTYLGWLPRDELIAVIDRHDLLLLPSHVEAFGTVALEAMARGRPALVSPACGIADWPALARGLYVMGADESLAQAFDRVMRCDEVLRRATAQHALQAARGLHAWNALSWLDWLDDPGGVRDDG